MAPSVNDEAKRPEVSFPRFDTGDDLYVLYRADGFVEFRSSGRDEFVNSDIVIDVRDVT